MLRDLSDYLEKRSDVNNYLIAEDINEYIKSKTIEKFFIQNGIIDIHGIINDADQAKREGTFYIGTNFINTIIVTDRLI